MADNFTDSQSQALSARLELGISVLDNLLLVMSVFLYGSVLYSVAVAVHSEKERLVFAVFVTGGAVCLAVALGLLTAFYVVFANTGEYVKQISSTFSIVFVVLLGICVALLVYCAALVYNALQTEKRMTVMLLLLTALLFCLTVGRLVVASLAMVSLLAIENKSQWYYFAFGSFPLPSRGAGVSHVFFSFMLPDLVRCGLLVVLFLLPRKRVVEEGSHNVPLLEEKRNVPLQYDI